MNSTAALQGSKQKYYMWVGVFFLIITGIVLSLYFSAMQIDYAWRWNRIPRYFAYHEQVEINSEIDGEVESISKKGEETLVRVKGLEGEESYSAPAGTVQV